MRFVVIAVVICCLVCVSDAQFAGFLKNVKNLFHWNWCEQRAARDIVPVLKKELDGRIAGQIMAKETIFRVLNNHYVSIQDKQVVTRRPLVMHFAGPTSVGKSLTALLIGKSAFEGVDDEGVPKGLMSVGMRRFAKQANGMNKLLDQIALHIHKCNRAVIILDDIQALNEDDLNMLMDTVENNNERISVPDAKDKTISLNRAVFIMTSDMGSEDFPRNMTREDAKERIFDILHNRWPKLQHGEVLTSGVVPFLPLSEEDLQEVVKISVNQLNQQLHEEYKDFWTGDVILRKGFAEAIVADCIQTPLCRDYAARGIERQIDQDVKDEISSLVRDTLALKNSISHDNIVLAPSKDKDRVFTVSLDKIYDETKDFKEL